MPNATVKWGKWKRVVNETTLFFIICSRWRLRCVSLFYKDVSFLPIYIVVALKIKRKTKCSDIFIAFQIID